MAATRFTVSRRAIMLAAGSAFVAPLVKTSARAAAELTVDPLKGETLATVVATAVAAGHREVRLLPGVHGPQVLQKIAGGDLAIVGSPGATVARTTLRGCSGLVFRDVAFRDDDQGHDTTPAMVQTDPSSRGIAFDNCSFAATDDSSSWTAQDWVDRPFRVGLLVRGPDVVISACRFFNLRNCLGFESDGGVVRNSTFERFGNDAIEFRGNDIRILHNTIRGGHHTPLDPMHADGIQGFPHPRQGTFSNVTIDGNTVEFVGPGDYMQGISIFDGRWRNVRIANNTVRVNMWNAIAVYGADGVVIEGNTVSSTDSKVRNWIEVRSSKTGERSTDVVVRNNVAPVFKVDPDAVTSNNRKNL